jgi:hypothetical protein
MGTDRGVEVATNNGSCIRWELEEVVFDGFIEFGDDARVVGFHFTVVGCLYTGNKKLGCLVLLRVKDQIDAHVSGVCVNNLTRRSWHFARCIGHGAQA